MEEESSLFGKVEYIITDSPSFLSAIYLYINHEKSFMMDTVKEYYEYCKKENVKFKNFILPRNIPYNNKGRYEDEFTAKWIDSMVEIQLYKYNIKYNKKTPKIKDVVCF